MKPDAQLRLMERMAQINDECVAAGPSNQADITNTQLMVLRTRMACSEMLEEQLGLLVDRPVWLIIWSRLRGGR